MYLCLYLTCKPPVRLGLLLSLGLWGCSVQPNLLQELACHAWLIWIRPVQESWCSSKPSYGIIWSGPKYPLWTEGQVPNNEGCQTWTSQVDGTPRRGYTKKNVSLSRQHLGAVGSLLQISSQGLPDSVPGGSPDNLENTAHTDQSLVVQGCQEACHDWFYLSGLLALVSAVHLLEPEHAEQYEVQRWIQILPTELGTSKCEEDAGNIFLIAVKIE